MYNPPRKPDRREAYNDGWTIYGNGRLRHESPIYPSYEERQAFKKGWDDHAEKTAPVIWVDYHA